MASPVFSRALRWSLTVSLIGAWFPLHPTRTWACSCQTPGPPSKELERAAAVFMGEAASVREFPQIFGVSGNTDPTTVRFKVKTVWKGAESHTRYVNTARNGASCGYTFIEGTEYVVYSPNGSYVSLCSRTRPLSEASKDLADLGQGSTPAVGTIAPMSFVFAFLAGFRGGLSSVLLILVMMTAGVIEWIGLRGLRKRRSTTR